MSKENAPTNFWTQWQQSALDESFAVARKISRLPQLWPRIQNIRKGVTPSEVIYEEDRLRLLHYVGDAKPRHATPVVFIYALVNRPYILDLKAGRSVVANFVERGFDTYMVDWGVPLAADRHLTLDDYINGYMANVLEYVCERTGSPQVSVLGYCMGGTMSAMYTALRPARVKNLILLAAPIDFATNDSLLNVWTRPENFDVNKFVDAFGNCPPEFLQAVFQLLRPVDNLIAKPINFYERMDNDRFVEDFVTMESWINDNIPVPGEVYREFVKYLYQGNRLTKNQMPVGKHIVDLGKITCPVLNIMAGEDDLVPCSQGMPFTELVSSKDRKVLLLKDSGHVGLAMGSKAQKELWPQACEWLAERS